MAKNEIYNRKGIYSCQLVAFLVCFLRMHISEFISIVALFIILSCVELWLANFVGKNKEKLVNSENWKLTFPKIYT